MLVVDDSSPDGTGVVVKTLQKKYPRLKLVTRPRKRGIGSAHKYALLYSINNDYDYLVTMDADFSHDPAFIPDLLAASGPNVFVTGSRYCEGGRSDYTGYRDFVSRMGNFAARTLLNLPLRELTTYFRVFDVASLRRLPLRYVHSEGYSYGVQLVYYLRKQEVELREVPIHFVDRLHGASKIPRWQIVVSAFDLLLIWARRIVKMGRDLSPDIFVKDRCSVCGDEILALKYKAFRKNTQKAAVIDAEAVAAYRCTAVDNKSRPAIYTCLNCGLEQVPQSQVPVQLEDLYTKVEDTEYLSNLDARKKTFARCFSQMKKWLPSTRGTLLEVGSYCGLFLREARRQNWDAEGVEPSRWAAEFARTNSEVTVHTGFLGENKQHLRQRYDVVVSWDVLEHVRDPVGFLRECGSMLPEGGTLFFSTLDIDNWFPKLLGKRWPWLIDMHIQYFSARTIADVLHRSGFELVAVETYWHYARMQYAINGLGKAMPRVLSIPLSGFARLIPSNWIIPVALGDIKLYVARKVQSKDISAI